MGALVFYCDAEQLLISGDALWQNGFGVVLPDQPGALAAAQDTLDRIAALDVTVVIPGHGQPFIGISAALDRCYERVEAFNADPIRMVAPRPEGDADVHTAWTSQVAPDCAPRILGQHCSVWEYNEVNLGMRRWRWRKCS
jgi:glyoxylase-like metal-dependent hydrolase (beta-lactamase superfamily II)